MGKNSNDKGFTLIEVVVSVAILAIITAPFLNSFVIAAKNNATANARQIVTNHSESVMEKFKATSFEMLTEEFTLIDKAVMGDHEGEKFYYYDSVNDYYVFNVPGTELTGESSSKYNVQVTMKPEKYDAPDLADVDGTKTAMFISEAYKYDDSVLTELEAQMNAIPDAQKYGNYRSTNTNAADNLKKNIVRTTYVTISYTTGTTPYAVQLDVLYECNVGASAKVSKKYEKIFLNNYENVPDVLMFYTPYPYTSAGHLDKVIVNNDIPEGNIPAGEKCRVYVANQKVSQQAGLYLFYNTDSSGNFIFQEGFANKNIYSDSVLDGLSKTEVYLSDSIKTNLVGQTNSLVGKKEAVKIYDLTVDVYWNGELSLSVNSSTDGQN